MPQPLPGGPVLRLLDQDGKLMARGVLEPLPSTHASVHNWRASLTAMRTATAASFVVRLYRGSAWDIKGTVGVQPTWSVTPHMRLDNVNVAKGDCVQVTFSISMEQA